MLLSSRLPTDKCVLLVTQERCRASKKTGSVIADLSSASSLLYHSLLYLDIWPRSNCPIFNNDVNERCVSRVRWTRPMAHEACLVSSPELTQSSDALPNRWKINRILLFFSSLLFFLCLSVSLCQNGLVPDVDTDRRARVPCSRLPRDWKKRSPFACLFILSKGRDAFSATFFAGYWTRQMSQRTFSERLSLKRTITRSATTRSLINERENRQGNIDQRGYKIRHLFLARFDAYS